MIEEIQKVQEKNGIEFIIISQNVERIIFGIRNGLGVLGFSGNWSQGIGDSLVFDGTPLVKVKMEVGDGFCPTCEKMVAAGYGLDQCVDFPYGEVTEGWNEPFENIAKSFEALKPLLGLLPVGVYRLSIQDFFSDRWRRKLFLEYF